MSDIKIIQTISDAEDRPCQLSRRRFLQAAGVGGVTVAMLTIPGCGTMQARSTPLPRKRVASLAELTVDRPKTITFPDPKSMCMLVKLGVPAGGGVGPDEDIVAFSLACPHMGMTLLGAYNAEHKGLGPCPSHLTRFDLTRYGIVISGHATESLPQVLLEVEANGDIYATGMRGLVYGRTNNLG
jgi:arsenite oxidase small subunit